MFAADQVEMHYDGQRVLGPLSLQITPGQTTALLGPSGSGKTTLLRLFAGLIQPFAGQVFFDGYPLDPARLVQLRTRTGYMIQEGGLFPHLSARANVALRAQDLGWPQDRMAARIEELAQLVALDAGLLDRLPSRLSGGQRQRVALMRALMLDPDALLVSHDMGEAAFLADQLVLLREGKLVQAGPAQAFASDPADSFVAQFMAAERRFPT